MNSYRSFSIILISGFLFTLPMLSLAQDAPADSTLLKPIQSFVTQNGSLFDGPEDSNPYYSSDEEAQMMNSQLDDYLHAHPTLDPDTCTFTSPTSDTSHHYEGLKSDYRDAESKFLNFYRGLYSRKNGDFAFGLSMKAKTIMFDHGTAEKEKPAATYPDLKEQVAGLVNATINSGHQITSITVSPTFLATKTGTTDQSDFEQFLKSLGVDLNVLHYEEINPPLDIQSDAAKGVQVQVVWSYYLTTVTCQERNYPEKNKNFFCHESVIQKIEKPFTGKNKKHSHKSSGRNPWGCPKF